MDEELLTDQQTFPNVAIAKVQALRFLENEMGVMLTCRIQPLDFEVDLRLWMPYVGKRRGLVVLPEPGDEVTALFPFANPDMGIAIWGNYNGKSQLPEGAAEGLILFEGRDGENARLHLRGALDVTIDLTEKRVVLGQRETSIGGDDTLAVAGNQITKVAGNQSANVDGSRADQVAGDEARAVQGNRVDSVAGGVVTTISGNRATAVGGNETRTVLGTTIENHTLGKTSNIGVAWTVVVAGPVTIGCLGAFTMLDGVTPIMNYDGTEFHFHKKCIFHAGTDGDRT